MQIPITQEMSYIQHLILELETSYSLNEIAKAFDGHPIEYISERRGEIKHSVCDPTFSKEELDGKQKLML